jgi:hypothetical protein
MIPVKNKTNTVPSGQPKTQVLEKEFGLFMREKKFLAKPAGVACTLSTRYKPLLATATIICRRRASLSLNVSSVGSLWRMTS